jgi:hypothetical protein
VCGFYDDDALVRAGAPRASEKYSIENREYIRLYQAPVCLSVVSGLKSKIPTAVVKGSE